MASQRPSATRMCPHQSPKPRVRLARATKSEKAGQRPWRWKGSGRRGPRRPAPPRRSRSPGAAAAGRSPAGAGARPGPLARAAHQVSPRAALSPVAWEAERPEPGPRAGAWTTPRTSSPSSSRPIRVAKKGRPATKFLVASMGSMIQRSRSLPSWPNSSPQKPDSGVARLRISRIASSEPRSATVTGEASPLSSTRRVAERKCSRWISPARRQAARAASR